MLITPKYDQVRPPKGRAQKTMYATGFDYPEKMGTIMQTQVFNVELEDT